jgi:exodeoxyribonuclease VII small subunit
LKRKNPLNFEANLGELERLVERMERGDLSLEDSLQQFEQGIQLIRACQQALQAAEQKVQLLMRDDAGERLGDFDTAPAPAQAEDEV